MYEDYNGTLQLVMPIETLLTFNRLKQLTTDIQVVVDAIKESDKLAVCLLWRHSSSSSIATSRR